MSNSGDTFYVIGAGFGRTGTSSFKKALDILWYGPTYHMFEVLQKSHAKQWLKFAQDPSDLMLLNSVLAGSGYNSSCDFPSAVFWKEQLELYPNAKVILTVRDAEKWHQSCMDTIFHFQYDHPASNFGLKVIASLGLPIPGMRSMTDAIIRNKTFHGDWSKENVIRCFNAHNQHVIDVCPKEKLLVFEVSQGWEPLCQFLGVPVPKEPFPHVNDTKEFQKMVHALTFLGYGTVGLGVLGGAAVLLAGLKYFTGSYLPFKF